MYSGVYEVIYDMYNIVDSGGGVAAAVGAASARQMCSGAIFRT